MADQPRRARRGARGATATLNRAIAALAFMPLASRAPLYGRLLWELARDGRTPTARKGLLAGAVAYLFMPVDLVPDWVPVLGGLDDLVVLVLALDLFVDGIPDDVLSEKLAALGLERSAFNTDMAQVRRLIPRPVRDAARQVPAGLSTLVAAIRTSGLGPKIRSWITTEDEYA